MGRGNSRNILKYCNLSWYIFQFNSNQSISRHTIVIYNYYSSCKWFFELHKLRRFGNSSAPQANSTQFLSLTQLLSDLCFWVISACVGIPCLRSTQPPQMWCRANMLARSHGYLRLRCRCRCLRARRSGKRVELGLVLPSSRIVFSQRAWLIEDQYPFGVPCVRLSAARPETQLQSKTKTKPQNKLSISSQMY